MPCKRSMQRRRPFKEILCCCVLSLGLGSLELQSFWLSWVIFPYFINLNNCLHILELIHPIGSWQALLKQIFFPNADHRKHVPREICLRSMPNQVLVGYYKTKCNKKPQKVALAVVEHKLTNIILAVLRDQNPFGLWI